MHLLNPEYIDHQIDFSRERMGVEALDAFLIDQPEVHIPVIGKEQLNRKLGRVFVRLERAVREGRIGCYRISTYEGFRVETDHPMFQKGHLARQSVDIVAHALAGLPNPVQRAIQFNRSTPGLGTTLVGISDPAHLEDALAVVRIPPLERKAYLSLYSRA